MAVAAPWIMMALTAASAAVEVHSTRQQANLDSDIANRNARLEEEKAIDAEVRGKDEESRVRMEAATLLGRQTALIGASGADTGSGSAIAILSDTAAMGELDALTVRSNYMREAWGHRTSAVNLRFSALDRTASARRSNFGTLLGAAASIFSQGMSSGAFSSTGSSGGLSVGGNY